MQFNSFSYILLFLPLTAAVYFSPAAIGYTPENSRSFSRAPSFTLWAGGRAQSCSR